MAEFPQSRTEEILYATINGEEYTGYPESRIEELLLELKEVIEEGGGGGGTTDYDLLDHKPEINGVTLSGNKTTSDLSLASSSDLANKVDKVSGKGLSANDYTDTDKTIVDGVTSALAGKADVSAIPTNVSDLNNDSGFITNAVNDLISYYLKSETYTKTEVNALIGAISTIHFEAVLTLPTENIQTNIIYLVPKSISQSDNIKDEYINLDGTTAGWEKIGETEIDLSGYVTTTDLNTALADYVQKSSTTGLLKNDGTVDTNTYATTSSLSDYVAKSQTAGLLKNDGTVDTNSYALASALPGIATSEAVGLVKPDGTTVTIDANGALSAIASLPENPITTAHGGTGNTDGYIRTGAASGSTIGTGATIEGADNEASGDYSHAEGSGTTASGDYSHAEGGYSIASGASSHAEGQGNATGQDSHAEGTYSNWDTADPTDNVPKASGIGSHAEGGACHASGDYSHAEGLRTTASNQDAHAEGFGTTASGANSHAEGYNTTASATCSHAGGTTSVASGSHSFAHGQYVNAGYAQQSVFGRYNNNKSTTLFEVGNGSADNARSNALEVTSTGDVIAAGDVRDGNGNSLSSVGGKANKPSASTDGNVAALDSNGNLVDSGKSVDEIGNVDFEIVDTDEAILKKGGYNAMTKSWTNCPTYLTGDQIWKDGDDIYFTNSGTWKLNKATNTWASYTWSGSNIPAYGYYTWTDGTNIYFNNGPDNQWKLNKSTNAWDRIYWNQNVNYGTQVWHGSDGNTYATLNNNTQYVLNGTQWNTKTWTGKVPQAANKIWNHKGETYYSNASYQWKLNKSTGQFEDKSWSGLTSFHGDKVWSNGEVAGYTTPDGVNYILDDATNTWKTITWDNNINNIDGHKVWTDGKKIYYSDYAAKEYELFPTRKYEEFDIPLKLSALSDTSLSSPSDGQILVFNGTTGKWENKDKEIYLEQSVTLSTSQTTTVTFSNAAFTATSVVDPAISEWGIFPEDVTVASGSCTVVMPKVSTAQTVTVGIFIKR